MKNLVIRQTIGVEKVQDKAILVVSFGSSYEDTRKKTIEETEKAIQKHFKSYKVYRAFTSPRIRKVIHEQGEMIDSVEKALIRMARDGISHIIVQPTFIICGKEYDEMCRVVENFKENFESIAIGKPLLYSMEDYFKVASIVTEDLGKIEEEEAVICMGHGVEHFMSVSYAALDYVFKESAHPDIYMANIEAYPGIEQVIGQLKRKAYKKVRIVPFMFVAGHHVAKEMNQKGEKGWVKRLEKEGYMVQGVMRGLGEISKIRELFVAHIHEAQTIN